MFRTSKIVVGRGLTGILRPLVRSNLRPLTSLKQIRQPHIQMQPLLSTSSMARRLGVAKTRSFTTFKSKVISKDYSNHHIAASGKLSVLKELYEKLGPEKFKEAASEVDPAGYTWLHYAAEYNKPEVVRFLVEALGDLAPEVAKRVTNAGDLPIDLGKKNFYSEYFRDDSLEFDTILLPVTQRHNMSSLETEINVLEIKEHYKNASPALLNNLIMAAKAVNKTRQLITDSGTHPSLNGLDRYFINMIDTNIQKIRDQIPNIPGNAEKIHKALVKFAIQHKLGNCEEYANVLAKQLMEMQTDFRIETYCIANGDHRFAVLGRDAKSDPLHPETWGESAVICDAWTGEVYPAGEAWERLKHYKNYVCKELPIIINVCGALNRNLHSLKPLFQFQPCHVNGRIIYSISNACDKSELEENFVPGCTFT
ncbi:MAG: hypothetical protein ACYCQI_17120 [Gammaproteobacteria bacterium]